MIVDLNHLPYFKAVELLTWCFENNVDREKSLELVEAMAATPVPEVEWTLEIPEHYVTFFLLKWS